MKLNCYSIYDMKALVYHPPFFMLNDAMARRALEGEVRSATSMIGQSPSDFVLYCIGEYTDNDGRLTTHSPLVHVCDAASLVPARVVADLSVDLPSVKVGDLRKYLHRKKPARITRKKGKR